MEENALRPTIGLEIHAELNTRTKMFCDSLNDPDEKHPNVNVCPVCLGHPGALPVPNRDAITSVIKVGLALGGRIAETAKFDRKNYFYPDLPKGYQISQYDKPLVEGGILKGVRIRRIHIEEDTGTLAHASGASGSGASEKYSLVDFNRAGVPLMELVTEPDFKSADDIADFARELRLILRSLGVSAANMEKGEMRIEANVSLNMGTKTELKNINSFKAVHDAVEYELKRQEEIIKSGSGELKQETRGWDELSQKTVSQRSKEEAHDYRYFPEPDIPPFDTSIFDIEALHSEIPELPEAKRGRIAAEYGLDGPRVEFLVSDQAAAGYFEEAASELRELSSGKAERNTSMARERNTSASAQSTNPDYLLLYNYLASDLRGLMNETGTGYADLKIRPENLARLTSIISLGKLTTRQAKDLLLKMFETGVRPEEVIESEGLGVASDETEIEAVILAVIAENDAAVDDYKKGKAAALQFLIGKAMSKLKGRAQPDVLSDLLKRHLG